jgi:outer membrane protein
VFVVDSGSVGAQAVLSDPRHAAASADSDAARIAVDVARAAARPTIGVSAGGEYHNYAQSPVGYPKEHGIGVQVGATAAYAIYQGGLVKGQIAEARAVASKADFDRATMDRSIAAEASTALARYNASLRTIAQNEKAVQFEQDTLAGVEIEAKGGERSVLDVLNAQLELLESRIALANARHDSYVAGIGVMTALDTLKVFS